MKRPRIPTAPRGIDRLLEIMASLRGPGGCPWDREQSHESIRFHAVEEVYELLDAIEDKDDEAMAEELGDLLLQVVFHCQLASEAKRFDFEKVASVIADKLIRRHPHVFGESEAQSVEAVWAQWEKIKKSEKVGTKHERPSALDGVPRQLPALFRAEKLAKKARKAGLIPSPKARKAASASARRNLGEALLDLAISAQAQGISAEEALRSALKIREKSWRRQEAKLQGPVKSKPVVQKGG